MVKTSCFHCRGHWFDSLGTKIPQAAWHSKKKKKVHTYIDIIYRGLCIYRFLVYNFFSDISKILAVPRPKGQNTRKDSIPGV